MARALSQPFQNHGAVQMKSNPDLRLFYIQRPAPAFSESPALQAYFPSLEVLFPSVAEQSSGSPTLAASELIVDISGASATVENLLTKASRQVPIWVRKTHLVDPIAVMSGECVLPLDGALPTFREAWQLALRKINDPYNEAYTAAVCACMMSRLVERGISPHFCRFYGTYSGRVAEYRYNITDDLSDIEEEKWFRDGLKSGAFQIVVSDPEHDDVEGPYVPWYPDGRKPPLGECGSSHGADSENQSVEGKEDVDAETEAEESKEESKEDEELQETTSQDIPLDGNADIVRPRIRLERADDETVTQTSETNSEAELDFLAVFKHFPVQLTFLERCDGTMDDLMEDEISDEATADMKETKEERWTAWIFQVIAGLTVAQQTYEFVHNDLHTNNVTWTGTGETHLYYHVQGAPGGDRFYRVPTYGRIFKIIDFGRATFRPPATKNAPTALWLPDAYAPGADAAGQYNCGPYFEQGKPKVVPNKSFDLCRLAVSMLETLWQSKPGAIKPTKAMTKESGRTQNETVSPLWNLMWLWLTDKDGKNVLRTPNGRERYPEFDLYCAIAKNVQNALPAQQLTLPLFDTPFKCRRKDIPADTTIWKLHAQGPKK